MILDNTAAVVRPLEAADLPETLALLNNELGKGYIKNEELSKYAIPGSKIARVATDSSGAIVAAVTGVLMLPGIRMSEVVHPAHADALSRLVREVAFSRVGILKTCAVSPSARGTGLDTVLAGATTDALFREGASCVLGMAYADDDGCRDEGMLNRLGFQMRGDIEGLWNQDSIEEGHECLSCGTPCQCTGRIFVHFRHRWAYNHPA